MSGDLWRDEKTMRRYLLGALPEAESDRFEERYFADDALFETLREAEDELIESYVLGELSHVEAERFRQVFMSSPDRRERVELAAALQRMAAARPAAARAASGPVVVEAPPARPRLEPAARRPWWRALFDIPVLIPVASALMIMVSAAFVWMMYQNGQLRRELEAAQARQPAARDIPLKYDVAAGAMNQVSLPAAREVNFVLDTGLPRAVPLCSILLRKNGNQGGEPGYYLFPVNVQCDLQPHAAAPGISTVDFDLKLPAYLLTQGQYQILLLSGNSKEVQELLRRPDLKKWEAFIRRLLAEKSADYSYTFQVG